MTIKNARDEAIKKLTNSPTAPLDADVLLSHTIKCSKSFLLAHRNDNLTDAQYGAFMSAIALRQTGLAVAYITGHKEFYKLDFIVTQDVLVPKPDTETLVEKAVESIKEIVRNKTTSTGKAVRTAEAPKKNAETTEQNEGGRTDDTLRIADICTGSGCVGIAAARELNECEIFCELTLTDISFRALEIAKQNASRLLTKAQFERTAFASGDLLNALSPFSLFDAILANPPYVPSDEVTELLKDGRGDPALALDGDADGALGVRQSSDGLAITRRLVVQAYEHLTQGGVFFLESGEYNAKEAAHLMKKAGFVRVETHCDLSGRPRVTTGRRSGIVYFPQCSHVSSCLL
ncbi:peptide chain release factor N(5)-glutamine methyltransferase [Treponema socranskii]|uniref:peptide chain release factor N(5)-glutamine methyltransferase n=1 Tax=Treponema socranskii TaxID=53419 RepID=UPI00287297B0|nr:peptide chain release factor N(5)-glutamine methyltransferase [Treponema socranskii]MDR9859807.1 peptide chain release factor N(5)-glutamine methyltransferase [Treponema socranskii]